MEQFFQSVFSGLLNIFSYIYDQFYQSLIEDNRYQYILDGLKNTVVITIFAVLLGVVIGTIIALVRVQHTNDPHKLRIANGICTLYLTIIRGTPVLVQLMIMYYVIIGTANIDMTTTAIFAFGINSGAYVAEVIRSGIQSVDRGQMEAGRSLGLSEQMTMRKIVLPQALKNVLPAIGNEFIALLKETSVAGYIGIQDLTKAGDIIRSRTYQAFFPLILTAVIYLVIVIGLSVLLSKFERRLHRSDNR